MSDHTPGPWFFDDGEGGRYFPHVVLGGRDPKSGIYITINTCNGRNGGPIEECIANARLIAAAPDLLAALKSVLHWVPEKVATISHPAYEAARAAIAKAERG